MAYTIDHNVTDSTTAGQNITLNRIETANYAVTTDVVGETRLTNLTSPLDAPETIGYKQRVITDIYANSGIDRVFWTPTHRGVEFLIQLRQTWSAVDKTDTTRPEYKFPALVNVTVRVAQNELVSESDVEYLLKEALGALYPDGLSRIPQILRGSLNPKG